MPSSAYLLVYHGSRDSRSQSSAHHLAMLVAKRLQQRTQALRTCDSVADGKFAPLSGLSGVSKRTQMPLRESKQHQLNAAPHVGTAALELAPRSLHEQIQQFGDRLQTVGCRQLHILPLFLLSGVHVKEDIPAEIQQARPHLEDKLDIHLHSFLGSHPQLSHYVKTLLDDQALSGSDATILMAHGSRREGGNAPIEAIASCIGATPAYWSVSPSLADRIQELREAGHRHITIFPYFLFPGGLTDAIAQTVHELSAQWSDGSLQLAQPLGATSEIADLVIDLMAGRKAS
ncbi:MAG: sirohydrochlorin chelatase [Elainellaceae cyanobacterium]